jgi:predicted O-methyltransferase YrrM
MKNEYSIKLNNFLFNDIKNFKNTNILEFGVRDGVSTKKFLEHCNKNKCKLYSIDIDDCSGVAKDKNWKFIQSRDDNFEFLEKKLPKNFKVILIDSFHNADHVKKILLYYWRRLKKGGCLFIDDICWIPYVKNNYRNHFNSEINNLETFNMLNEVLIANQKNIHLTYSFVGSGMAKIVKLNNRHLNRPIKILTREFSLKNMIRKLMRK